MQVVRERRRPIFIEAADDSRKSAFDKTSHAHAYASKTVL
jgi:hypothetical protein